MFCGRVFCKDLHTFTTLDLGLKGTNYLLQSSENVQAVCLSSNGLLIQDNNGKTRVFDQNTLVETAAMPTTPGVLTYLLKTFDALVPNSLFFANCTTDPMNPANKNFGL